MLSGETLFKKFQHRSNRRSRKMMENEEERMMKRVEMTMKAFPELQKDYLHLRKPLSHKHKKNHKNPYPTVKL